MRAWGILCVGLAVPILLLTMKKERALTAWICFSVGLNIFDARVGINLAAARIAGLLLIVFAPFGAYRLGLLFRTRPSQLLLLQLAYLTVLGLIFGFVMPWPDDGFIRPFAQQAQGRAIIHMLRVLADTGIVLFIARQILRGTPPSDIIRFLLIGTSVAAFGGILEAVSGLQLYALITGYPINEVADRVRGFNFEPRGLGLAMAHGTFFALIWNSYRPSTSVRLLALVHASVLLIAVSASALGAAAVMWIAWFIAEPRGRRPSLIVGASGVAAGILLMLRWGESRVARSWTYNISGRFSIDDIRNLSAAADIQSVFAFLDIFDYTAAMFLISAPLAALVGAGPGLIVIPGSNFIPAISRWSWVGQSGEGITGLPFMGILFELANGGLLGLILWVCLISSCYYALHSIERLEEKESIDWSICRAAFVVAVAGYAVQVSPLAAFLPVFLGVSLGAAGRLRARRAAGFHGLALPHLPSREPSTPAL